MSSSVTQPSPSALSPKPTLYALLVGIGAYERVRPLRGPVGDVQVLTRYLNGLPDFDLHLLTLTDQQASKSAIIAGFQTHLTQAGPADTVLFYFSGHGTQEEADTTIWTTETDGKLECTVCFDGGTINTWDFLLTDKELRYLIGPVSATGAHVVTIFDCCNSGDNTRASDLLAAAMAGQDVRDRRLPQSAPQRPYDAFCFHDVLTAEQVKEQGLEVAMPQGAHIQMAACESDEVAVEMNGEGIFTKNLLAVLEAAHGQVSYQDLQNRTRQYMRFGYEQRPRVYIPDEQASLLLNRGFLNQPIDPDTLSASATYNQREGWLLDVGAIHGMGQTARDIQLQDPTGQRSYPASIKRIGPDYTVLDITDEVRTALEPASVYRATVAGLLTQPIRLHFTNHGGPTSDLPDLLKPSTNPSRPALTDGIVIPEDTEARADYTLHSRNGLYYLTNPADDNRPLIRPLRADDPQVFSWLTDDLRHVAKWQYLRQFRNPAVDTPVLAVELIPSGETSIQLSDASGSARPSGAIPIHFTQTNSQWTATLTVRLTNSTDRPLYCTALYLSRDFMSFTGFLPTNYRLEPGQSVTLGLADKKAPTGRQTTFRLKLEEVIRQYNWASSTEHIKLLVTTDPLSEKTLSFLILDALPSSPVLADRLKPTETRAGFETDTTDTEPFPDWSTQTITLQLVNPLYNTVRADELSQMLALPTDAVHEDMMADFALGLYYEPDTTTELQPTLKLREDIRILTPDDDQRGLWNDLKLAVANQVSHQVQNRQYRQNLVRYPDRLRIVAEGDSWFQYPFLLRDIVDYLSGVYSVFSVAASGATLDDYLKNSQFLEAIAQVKPTFFLLSGGLNDLLGKSFADFLTDTPINGQPGPQRYLTNAFGASLMAVGERLGRIFRLVQLGYPQVRVLVHGYDYLIPAGSDTSSGRTNGLGKTMIDKGITDPAEREAIIHYIIDAFNEQLRQVASAYPNVTCLDLRGTIRRTDSLNYWYDEIHPNDKGFLSLSSKFVAQINQLKAAPQPLA